MPNDTPVPTRPSWRRRLFYWCACGTGAMALVLALTALALVVFAIDNVLRLPDWARARIEARLDAAMAASDLSLGGVGIGLTPGEWVPKLVLHAAEMSVQGNRRALFPEVSVYLDPRAALAGRVRPRTVEIGGAGLHLARDADGSFDLALTDAPEAEERDLAETMALIDTMFDAPTFEELEEITGDGMTLSLEDAQSGNMLRIGDASLLLKRSQGALILVVGGVLEERAEASASLSVSRRASEGRTAMRMQFRNIATRDLVTVSPALAWLGLLEAPLSGAVSTELADDGSIGDLAGTLDIGAGELNPGEGGRRLPFTSVRAYFDYAADAARLRFSELTVEAPALSTTAQGHADLLDGPSYVGQFRLSGIMANPEHMFEAPLEFDGGAVDLRLQLDPLVVDLGQVVLFDDDLHVAASGRIEVGPEGTRTGVDIRIPRLDAARVVPLWPLDQLPRTRAWLADNLLGGEVLDAVAGIRVAPGAETRLALNFDFREARVRALRDMAPIEDGHGYLTLIGPSMTLAVHGGQVAAPDGGTLDLSGSVMRIPNVHMPAPETEFNLAVAGPIPSLMALLNGPPMSLFRNMTRDPTTLAEGDVALRADLHLPIRRGLTLPDIRYDVIGELTDMRSDTLVPDRVLSAETLDLRVVPDRIEIGGRAMLDSVPATATWSRALGPDAPRDGLVEGRATLSARALDDLGIVLPPGMVSGRGPAEFTLQLPPDGPPRLAVASDLNGIGIDIAGLGWQLSPRQTGRLEMDVVLGPTPSVPAISLTARDLSMTGAISLAPGGGMDRFDIDRFTVTPWLDVNGALIGRGQGRAPRIEVLGGTADMARAPAINTDAGREDGVPGGGPLQISLDRLRVSEGIDLTDLRADLDLGGGLSGQFRGLVNGQAPLSGSLIPTGTGPAVRMTSDDGGAVLRAASVFSDGYGGDMVLVLQPTGERGTYDGRMTIDSPRLRDAPAMAELLNLVSVVGMIEQLTGEGINLGEVEARFRLTPRAITIAEGSALGPSMGISMDGLYDIAARRYDMQGVISPFYLINGLIGAIFSPRREGLFGFSYRLTGGPGETSVSVNPLSILTPGIFREIFRRPPPQVTQ